MAHDQAPTVLVVEDDAGIQDLLHEILVDEGYRVLRATDGVQGFDLAAADRPAVILLDTGRCLATGEDLLARLRQDRSTTDIPVIALTWPASLVEDGPDGLVGRIEMPFDLDVLLEQIARLAARQGPTVAACTDAHGMG